MRGCDVRAAPPGRRRATADRLPITWKVGDAEALPFDEGTFDVVLSSFGIMFAPNQARTASELVRVCRKGGKIGLANWTPEGFIGHLFATMKPYAPPPPPGASPPPLWGNEDLVRTLFGDRVADLKARRQTVRMDHCSDPVEFREYWKRNYGPTIAAYRFNQDQPGNIEALERDFLAFLTDWNRGGAWDAEYLLVTAIKR